MPLYTCRVRWQLTASLQRGAGFAEQTYHFVWADDEAAADAAPTLIEILQSQPVARRMMVQRGDPGAHEFAIFRRDIDEERTWDRVHTEIFSLNEYATVDLNLGPPGVEYGAHVVGTEAPLYPDQRGAVLVRCRTPDPAISRRIYIGPLSPIPYFLTVSINAGGVDLFELPGRQIMHNLHPSANDGDDAPVAFVDSLDRWKINIANDARDLVGELRDADHGGNMVVASWRHANTAYIDKIDASLVRAHLRRRGIRAEMTDLYAATP